MYGMQKRGRGSGEFVLIQHDDEISSISVEKTSICNSFAYEGEGGQGKSYEMPMTGDSPEVRCGRGVKKSYEMLMTGERGMG